MTYLSRLLRRVRELDPGMVIIALVGFVFAYLLTGPVGVVSLVLIFAVVATLTALWELLDDAD